MHNVPEKRRLNHNETGDIRIPQQRGGSPAAESALAKSDLNGTLEIDGPLQMGEIDLHGEQDLQVWTHREDVVEQK